ncbi:MAG: 1-acyl-sn-glycerol-3-phosphate acyltransferase [Clostridia bacterium]|nr:1-acyl-sn-glycerol-3-phosphate acyltransferase [Clostridia bacterium]
MKEPIFYRVIRGPLAAIFNGIYKPTVIGKEHIPENGRIILAGNHTNYFDCLLVASATKRCVHYLAKDELMKGPLKYIFGSLGIIPVNRRSKDPQAVRKAEEYLLDEKLIGIFPEGTINRTDDVIMPFRFGAVKFANDTDTPILPFAITGAYKPFKKTAKIRFFEPVRVENGDITAANKKLEETISAELIKEGFKK